MTLDNQFETDRIAQDGVYTVGDVSDMNYDIRKLAEKGKELGLEPGDQLPPNVLESCLM